MKPFIKTKTKCFLVVKSVRDSQKRQRGKTFSLFGSDTSLETLDSFTGSEEQVIGDMKEKQGVKLCVDVTYQVPRGDCSFYEQSHRDINNKTVPRSGKTPMNNPETSTARRHNTVKTTPGFQRKKPNLDKHAAVKAPFRKKTFELTSDTESKSSTNDLNTTHDDVSEIYGLYLLEPSQKPSHIPGLIGDIPRTRLPRLYLIDDDDDDNDEDDNNEPQTPPAICTLDDTVTDVLDMYTSTPQDPQIPDVPEDVQQLPRLPLSLAASSASESGSSSFYITPSLQSWVNGTAKRKEKKKAGKLLFDPYRHYFCFSLRKTILKGDGKDCDCLGCRQDCNRKRIV